MLPSMRKANRPIRRTIMTPAANERELACIAIQIIGGRHGLTAAEKRIAPSETAASVDDLDALEGSDPRRPRSARFAIRALAQARNPPRARRRLHAARDSRSHDRLGDGRARGQAHAGRRPRQRLGPLPHGGRRGISRCGPCRHRDRSVGRVALARQRRRGWFRRSSHGVCRRLSHRPATEDRRPHPFYRQSALCSASPDHR